MLLFVFSASLGLFVEECLQIFFLVSGEVLVWRVGLRDESGAICQVEDLLTVRHS